MKGYVIGTELYIFPQEADTFEVGEDVTKIYIQHEQLNAFKEANETIANLMVGYNYNTMTCLPKAWAGHTNDDYEADDSGESGLVSPELAWSADNATVTINADDNVFPTLTNPHDVIVEYTSSNDTVADITNQNAGTIGLYSAGTTTISAVFAGDETYISQTVSYTLTVETSGESGESGKS